MKTNDHPLLSIVINIVIPVMILNKGAAYMNPVWCLVLALSFPLIYGLRDYFIFRSKNYVSILGTVNTTLTGGFALSGVSGFWFAVKEASLPTCIGLFVLLSAFTQKPLAKFFFLNPQIVRADHLALAVKAREKDRDFHQLVKLGTLLFSITFFFSATLNFLLALHIFKNINGALSARARAEVLNHQIAHMTYMSFLVVAFPLLIFTSIFMYWFYKKIHQISGIPFKELLMK